MWLVESRNTRAVSRPSPRTIVRAKGFAPSISCVSSKCSAAELRAHFAPQARIGLASPRLTAECIAVMLPGNGATSRSRTAWPRYKLGAVTRRPLVAWSPSPESNRDHLSTKQVHDHRAARAIERAVGLEPDLAGLEDRLLTWSNARKHPVERDEERELDSRSFFERKTRIERAGVDLASQLRALRLPQLPNRLGTSRWAGAPSFLSRASARSTAIGRRAFSRGDTSRTCIPLVPNHVPYCEATPRSQCTRRKLHPHLAR